MTTTLEAVGDFGITVSDRAAARIGKILAKEPAGSMLRVSVNGGGCSGFQYEFNIDSDQREDDLAIQSGDVVVLIDPTSADCMRGSVIDFADELIGAAFRIQNPLATASCGCGTSFSL